MEISTRLLRLAESRQSQLPATLNLLLQMNPLRPPSRTAAVEANYYDCCLEIEPKSTKAAAKIEKFTDLGNARRFVARYRDTILYCEGWTRWLLWDKMRWAEDERLEALARAGDLIRSLYPIAGTIEDEDRKKPF